MNLSLHYDGALASAPSGSNVVGNKMALRRVFSPQIAAFCAQNPVLKHVLEASRAAPLKGRQIQSGISTDYPIGIDDAWYYVEVAGGQFVPLITRNSGLIAEIHLTFFRRERPGSIFHTGGDLDNRLKTLCDGLRVPHEVGEVSGIAPGERLYCLLEDDSLITSWRIDTERLWVPLSEGTMETDVKLSMRVVITPEVYWGR